MAQWDISNISSLLLSTQTDADSPLSQFTMDKIRLTLEQLQLLTYDQGSTEGSVSALTTGTNTVITCAASSYGVDDFNGMTLLITTGLAKGNLYTIDDVSTSTGAGAKLTLTGDNAYADGARANDTYKILYDQLVNTDGHDHDGTNSKNIDVPMQVFAQQTAVSVSNDTSIATIESYFYKQAYHDTLYFQFEQRSLSTQVVTVTVILGSASTTLTSTGNDAYSTETDSIDISGVASGWQLFRLRTNKAAPTTGSYQVRRFGAYVI